MYSLIYFSNFIFLREMSAFLNKNVFSCYFLNLTFKMRDYLNSDQKRQIWINLELYFEIYEFSNF